MGIDEGNDKGSLGRDRRSPPEIVLHELRRMNDAVGDPRLGKMSLDDSMAAGQLWDVRSAPAAEWLTSSETPAAVAASMKAISVRPPGSEQKRRVHALCGRGDTLRTHKVALDDRCAEGGELGCPTAIPQNAQTATPRPTNPRATLAPAVPVAPVTRIIVILARKRTNSNDPVALRPQRSTMTCPHCAGLTTRVTEDARFHGPGQPVDTCRRAREHERRADCPS